ncbi:MAG: cadherin-like domain-containing protein, partial [Cellvibrionaceae bacterium]|nr:cadherin-like domain-containing protein [Cellvibrionaceae bacterium]
MSNLMADSGSSAVSNLDLANYTGKVVASKGQVTVDDGQSLNLGQSLGQGQLVQTGPDSVVIIRFPDGGMLVLGHQQSIELSPRLLAMIKEAKVEEGADEGVDFDRLQQGLEGGLSLEELLPAAASAGTAPTSAGVDSAVANGVRFVLTGDDTIPLAGFETTAPSTAAADSDEPSLPIDSAPEAADDFDSVKATGIATGNVVTGLDDGEQSDANELDGNADDSGINGYAQDGNVVVAVAVGDQPALENGGVGVQLVSDKGSLTLNADGSYVYVPNRDASGFDVFTYTIIDADDDTSSATLTINIDGIPLLDIDAPNSAGGDPSTWVNTVEEGGLPGGTGGSSSTDGSFRYLPGDGLPNISIGGVPVVVAGELQTDTIQGVYGTLVITSVTPTQINYTYTLDKSADHSDSPVNERFPITIVDDDDSDDDDISADLLIQIIDDKPIAEDDTDEIDASLVATGNVISGVDVPAGDSNSQDGEADAAGADGFDGPAVVGVVA